MFENARSILLVKLSSIGDVVHSLPVLAALRRKYPQAHIAWAVGPAAADVVAGSPHLSETLVVGGGESSGPGIDVIPPLTAPRQLARALRSRHFDLSFDLQGLFKSALLAYLSGARDRVGFRNLQEGAFLLNNRRLVADRRDVHAVEGYLGFARAVDAPVEPLDFTIATSEADRQAVEGMVGSQGDLVALVPGARWESKRWPPQRFAALADVVADQTGHRCVVVGSSGDKGIAEQILGAARTPILDLTGRTTLKQLVEVFRRCRASVANDTGPMHLSAAAGAPTVALFGPTDPHLLGPYGRGHAAVASGVNCRPCRKRSCHPTQCMESITVEQVAGALKGVLAGASAEGPSDRV